MKNKLPVLTAAVLLAAGSVAGYRSYQFRQHAADTQRGPESTAAADNAGSARERGESSVPSQGQAESTVGDKFLVQAITQLERRGSVTARLRHQVSLDDRLLKGVGGYWQQGSGDELKVRLELQVFSEETSLLQVSSGRFLWTDCRLPTGRSITRLDLRQLRVEADREASQQVDVAPGQANWLSIQPELSLRYGGLPTLLSSLAEHFTFLPPQAMRWTPSPPLAHMPETIPVYAIVGHWKSESLSALMPALGEVDAASASRRLAALPERLPQEVLLLFGQADLFPYRVEFRKLLNPSPESGTQEPMTPFQLSGDPLVLLELDDVSFDTAIAASQFDFAPGDADWDDHTAEYLNKIRRERQAQMATRVDKGPDLLNK